MRKVSYWDDPVGELINHLNQPRPGIDKITVIEHNARSFDLQFILDRILKLHQKPTLKF